MKRYLLFAYEQHYPDGAEHDFKGDFSTIEEVNDWKNKNNEYDYYEMLDIIIGKWIDL